MEVIEKKLKEVEVLEDVICDCCGKSCRVYLDSKRDVFNLEYMTLESTWGYGTKKDLEQWSAHICEQCVDEKFSFIRFKKRDLGPLDLSF